MSNRAHTRRRDKRASRQMCREASLTLFRTTELWSLFKYDTAQEVADNIDRVIKGDRKR